MLHSYNWFFRRLLFKRPVFIRTYYSSHGRGSGHRRVLGSIGMIWTVPIGIG